MGESVDVLDLDAVGVKAPSEWRPRRNETKPPGTTRHLACREANVIPDGAEKSELGDSPKRSPGVPNPVEERF